MKKQSSIGRIWELGEKEHGKLITAVILAVIGVASGMAPYLRRQKLSFCCSVRKRRFWNTYHGF